MKKHRAASDSALLEMLRRRGAVIGATAGERIQAAIAQQASREQEAGSREQGPISPLQAPRSSIRRFKSQTETRFAAYLDGLVAAKKILRWRYEAERLQLAEHGQPAVTYTPDFVAWLADGGRIFFEVKSKFRRDSDTETRRIFLWARQQFGDCRHEFRAFREIDGRPGEFLEMWGEELALTSIKKPARFPRT